MTSDSPMLAAPKSASAASNSIGNAKKFVAVQGNDEVPGVIIKRTLDEVRHARTLIEDSVAFAAQRQRQSFLRQFAKDVRRRIRAAMIKNIKTIEKCGIVPNEGFYDVALAPHHRNCSKTHSSRTSDY